MSEYETCLSCNDDELRKQERVGSAKWLLVAEALENNICKYIYCTILTLRSWLVTCYATSSAEQMFMDGCDRVCSSSYCIIFITVVALWLSSVTEYLGCEFSPS